MIDERLRINHRSIFDIEKVIRHYSQKDGVAIKYVCTSALGSEEFARDIYFRETPHPQFGNRYFALYHGIDGIMICNADRIEDVSFGMIESKDGWEYSQHRHDYRTVGDSMIDGGRAYVRRGGSAPFKTMRVKDGEFIDE